MDIRSAFINIAHAQGNTASINTLISKIVDNIVMPVVGVIFALAFVMFVWGIFGFFKGGDDPSAREDGQRHILWGVIGMAIMVSVFGIVRFVASSVGQSSSLGF